MTRKNKVFIFLLLLFLFVVWMIWGNFRFVITHYNIINTRIPQGFDGFKIAHISDLHNHQWGSKLMSEIKNEQVDIIVVTGDLLDSSKPNLDIALEFIEAASTVAPVYYVTGNHEAWLKDDYTILEDKLIQAGVNMMDNQSFMLVYKNDSIQIMGVQDPAFLKQENSAYIQEAFVKSVITDLIDPDVYTILLSHRPELFVHYVESSCDLVLSGHAHGGQFRFPFIKGVLAPNQGFFPKYTSGIYTEDKTDMIVSRGLGNSIVPLRINNTPELVIVTLRSR